MNEGTIYAPPPMPRRKRAALAMLIAALFALFCATGCMDRAYIKADRATHDVVAPYTRARIIADDALTPEQKDRKLTTLETWELRIRKAEGN